LMVGSLAELQKSFVGAVSFGSHKTRNIGKRQKIETAKYLICGFSLGFLPLRDLSMYAETQNRA
jgi:hypothetical protein